MSKARDVIPGWPRGRSTTPSYRNERWKYVLDWWFRESQEMRCQLALDENYHLLQEEMVHTWFARYRLQKGWVDWVQGFGLDQWGAGELGQLIGFNYHEPDSSH